MSRVLEQFGRNLRAARLRAQLTQEQVAELSGSHPNYIGAVERGERNPTLTKLLAISASLDCSLDDLLVDVKGYAAARPGKRKA